MGWIVFIALILFYFLGVNLFHATGPVHILPFAAIVALIADFWLARRAKAS